MYMYDKWLRELGQVYFLEGLHCMCMCRAVIHVHTVVLCILYMYMYVGHSNVWTKSQVLAGTSECRGVCRVVRQWWEISEGYHHETEGVRRYSNRQGTHRTSPMINTHCDYIEVNKIWLIHVIYMYMYMYKEDTFTIPHSLFCAIKSKHITTL